MGTNIKNWMTNSLPGRWPSKKFHESRGEIGGVLRSKTTGTQRTTSKLSFQMRRILRARTYQSPKLLRLWPTPVPLSGVADDEAHHPAAQR